MWMHELDSTDTSYPKIVLDSIAMQDIQMKVSQWQRPITLSGRKRPSVATRRAETKIITRGVSVKLLVRKTDRESGRTEKTTWKTGAEPSKWTTLQRSTIRKTVGDIHRSPTRDDDVLDDDYWNVFTTKWLRVNLHVFSFEHEPYLLYKDRYSS